MLVPFWSLRRSRLRSKGWKKKPKRLGTPGLKWRCFLFGMIFQMENDRKWRSTAKVPRKPQAWWRKAPPRWVFDNGLGMEGGGVDVTSLDHAVVAKCSEPWWCYLWIIQTGNQLRSFGRSLRGVSCAMMAWDYWLLLVGALEYFSLSLSLSLYIFHPFPSYFLWSSPFCRYFAMAHCNHRHPKKSVTGFNRGGLGWIRQEPHSGGHRMSPGRRRHNTQFIHLVESWQSFF